MGIKRLIIGVIVALSLLSACSPKTDIPLDSLTNLDMNISSPSFENGQNIPSKFTCDAENVNPELRFSNVPESAESLVLISHDPDAPREGGWTHWVIINMDPKEAGIKENSKPGTGREIKTSFGQEGYGGPCPPSGSHRYFFYLYALNTTLNLSAEATREDVEKTMEGHILEKAELVGLYERQ